MTISTTHNTPYISEDTDQVSGDRVLVVLKHNRARIFRSEGAGPAAEIPPIPRIEETTPATALAMIRQRERSPRNAEPLFEAVAKVLRPARQSLVLGAGTGFNNEMERFITWLSQHYPVLAQRISGQMTVDCADLTEEQVLGMERNFYAIPRELHPVIV